jgi:hypothetical protein
MSGIRFSLEPSLESRESDGEIEGPWMTRDLVALCVVDASLQMMRSGIGTRHWREDVAPSEMWPLQKTCSVDQSPISVVPMV